MFLRGKKTVQGNLHSKGVLVDSRDAKSFGIVMHVIYF